MLGIITIRRPQYWQGAGTVFGMLLAAGPLVVLFNRGWHDVAFHLPPGPAWDGAPDGVASLPARTVLFLTEKPAKRRRST